MRNWAWLLLLAASLAVAAEEPLRSVGGLSNPTSALVGPDGRIYVLQAGEIDKNSDGSIVTVSPEGKIERFATLSLNDPHGLVKYKNYLFVSDRTHVMKLNYRGRTTLFAVEEDFPAATLFLNSIVVDEAGNLYVADGGKPESGGEGAIYKISRIGRVELVVCEQQDARIKSPHGLLLEDKDHLLVVDYITGDLLRINLAQFGVEKIAGGFVGTDGMARDKNGTLYLSDGKSGRVSRVDLKQTPATHVHYSRVFQSVGDISLTADEQFILVPDTKAGTLTWLPVKQ